MTRPPIVIGIGNPDRGDDAVGVQVARQVAAERLDLLTLEFDDPSEALDAWEPEDTVVVADAIRSGGEPGDIHVVDVLEQKLPAGNWSAGGTHALGLAAVVELARSLDLLPKRLVVVGIEAGQFRGNRWKPSSSSQWGRLRPLSSSAGLWATRWARRVRGKHRWFRKNRSRSRYPFPSSRRKKK